MRKLFLHLIHVIVFELASRKRLCFIIGIRAKKLMSLNLELNKKFTQIEMLPVCVFVRIYSLIAKLLNSTSDLKPSLYLLMVVVLYHHEVQCEWNQKNLPSAIMTALYLQIMHLMINLNTTMIWFINIKFMMPVEISVFALCTVLNATFSE